MLNQIMLLIITLIFLGCDKGEVYIKKNKLAFQSCELKVPSRYHFNEYIEKMKMYTFSYEDSGHLEKNIYSHLIQIEEKEDGYISHADTIFSEGFDLVSVENFNDIKLFRYKPRDSDNKQETCKKKNSCKEVEMYFKNNYLLIYSKDFLVTIEETDEYIDEIYTMVENCASQMITKKEVL